jgi:SAM-dependent methyltransferase
VRSSEPSLADVRYQLLQCERCGSAVTTGGRAPELHDQGAYRPGNPRLYALARPLLAAFDRQRLRMITELAPPPARLLDAGAGRGRFVGTAQAAGYQAEGIEPSRRGVEATGAPIMQTTIEAAQIPAQSLDVVSLWHVLEHLDDPRAALHRIHSWLKPDGGLVIGVPNLDSWQARIGGERWYHLDVPRHRTHFTAAGLSALLAATGFEPVRTHHLLAEHNPFGMWQSVVNRITRNPSYAYNALKRNAPLRSSDLAVTLLALPLVVPAALLELVAGLARRGGTIAVLARRAGSAGGLL